MIALLATIAVLLVLILAAVTGTLDLLFYLGGLALRGAFALACVAVTVGLVVLAV